MPPDDAYTMMQQGVGDQALSGDAPDPRMAAPAQMDPGSMATLFGDDEQGEQAPDNEQGEMPPDQGGDQAPDQAGGQVDQGKLQAVLSDPGLLMAVAQTLKTLGTGDDTDLVHVTEQEKAMLKQGGGAGTPNPTTGLLQYLTKQEADQQGVDWYGMHPDDRVAMIASRGIGVPGWNNNWWTNPREATQGGMTRNFTGEDFANANVAVTPSWGTALNMAGIVSGMATGGPIGAIVGALAKNAFGGVMGDIFGKDSLLAKVGDFSTPGGRLSPEATARVAAAYNDAISRGFSSAQVMNAGEQALESERAALGGGEGAQTGGQGPGKSAGVGVDAAGHAYGTNIGGAGISHNMAAGGLAAAQAAADRSRAFAARDYGRATPAGSGGGNDGGGGVGNGGGGDRGGGMGGGVGHDHGSNRSM